MQSIYHDIPRLYTAVAEWAACMVYILLLGKSYRRSNFAIKSIAALVVQILYLEITGELPNVLWIPCMVTAALLMYLFIIFSLKVTAREGLYCWAKAFLLAELAASLEWQIHTYFVATRVQSYILQFAILIVVYAAVFALAYKMEKKMFSKTYLEQLSLKEVLAAVGCVVAIFAFSNMSFVITNEAFTPRIKSDIFLIRTLIDIMGVVILYAFQSRICEYAAEAEMSAMQNALNNQYMQYCNYLDNFEMMQIMRHDLKHQITGLRAETDAEERKKWLDGMEEELNANEINMNTGNSVLDAILGAKSLQAKKNHIQMTCVINGELLNFIDVADICSIFGNALDNALENAIMIHDEKKRLINISVLEQKAFIIVKIANYCENPVEIKSGKIPETTKANKKDHGFGLKSIRKSVEKYEGTVTMGMDQGWFVLNLLFLKAEDKAKS